MRKEHGVLREEVQEELALILWIITVFFNRKIMWVLLSFLTEFIMILLDVYIRQALSSPWKALSIDFQALLVWKDKYLPFELECAVIGESV